MNVTYINPLLESTIDVLSTMANIDISPGQPSVKESTKMMGDITGLIDLNSKQAHGSLSISFTNNTILNIAQKMLDKECDSIDESVIDAVGEITNMITGAAKRLYYEEGLDFDLTRPSVLVGSEKSVNHSVKGTTIMLPFKTEFGELYVEVCFK